MRKIYVEVARQLKRLKVARHTPSGRHHFPFHHWAKSPSATQHYASEQVSNCRVVGFMTMICLPDFHVSHQHKWMPPVPQNLSIVGNSFSVMKWLIQEEISLAFPDYQKHDFTCSLKKSIFYPCYSAPGPNCLPTPQRCKMSRRKSRMHLQLCNRTPTVLCGHPLRFSGTFPAFLTWAVV